MGNRIRLFIMGVALTMFAASAHATPYDVFALGDSYDNGLGGGISTIILNAGQGFTVTVDPNDLWNAGELPRWSNADGLAHDIFATGTDESSEPSGTLIGTFYPFLTHNSFSFAYGSLIGRIGSGDFFFIGTSYSGTAPISGTLNLYYWDDYTPDNTEHITANITTNPVPEPATMLLFGFGLAGFSIVGRRFKK